MTKRVAFARICQESNALSPVPTTLADFESQHYVTGAELLDRCRANGAHFSNAELDTLDAMKAADAPAEDKWRTR